MTGFCKIIIGSPLFSSIDINENISSPVTNYEYEEKLNNEKKAIYKKGSKYL